MKKTFIKRMTALLLVISLAALSACGGDAAAESTADVGQSGGKELTAAAGADNVFSLNSCAADGFNPYVTKNSDNMLVDQLVYDNVFEVDEDYNLSSRVVLDSYSTDGMYWYLTIDTSIQMHDGTTLTASDVSYSISLALRSTRYSGRFSTVWGAYTSGDDTVVVSLSKANYMLPYLLTVPIIKYGSYGESQPVGSGGYKFSEDGTYLEAFTGYAGYDELPVSTVYLKEYSGTEEVIAAFGDSYIDLVTNDRSSKTNVGYGGNTETRYYTTTNMHYIGFNMKSDFVEYDTYRYALQLAVDRAYAAETLMNGAAVAAALPILPKCSLYNTSIASSVSYDLDRCKTVLYNIGVRDYDNDGKLEYMETGIPLEINVNFIVCSESAGKGDIASKLVSDLKSIGLNITLNALSWDDYVQALADGEYDMYYGEVKLSPDFNLTPLFEKDGAMNYGGVDDDTLLEYIDGYLAAPDDTRSSACDTMLSYLSNQAYIIPVCFERQEVISHRNVISGINPCAGNIFLNITNWSIYLEGE